MPNTSIKPSYLAGGIKSTWIMETAGGEAEETLERALKKRWYNTSFFKLAFKVLQMTSVFSKCWGPAAFLNKIYYHWLLPLLALYVVTMLGSRIELVLKKREHYASVCPEQEYAFMPLLLSLWSLYYGCGFTHLTSAVTDPSRDSWYHWSKVRNGILQEVARLWFNQLVWRPPWSEHAEGGRRRKITFEDT